MHEASKALMRRLHDNRFSTRYFVGDGIDIGCGPDSIAQYVEQFPLMRSVKNWDLPDGDAQYLETIADESMDFVHSSHCLEHMVDVDVSLNNWLRVLKPGGHAVIMIPDEDLYEQGIFPSTNNTDHKWTFTLHKQTSWSDKSVNVFDLLAKYSNIAQIIKVELLDSTFRYNLKRFDQTLTPIGECAIEFVLRKLPQTEIARKGRYKSA